MNILPAIALSGSLLGGAIVVEDRYNNETVFVEEREKVSADLVAVNSYIEQRMADQRIDYLNHQLQMIMNKAQYFPLSDYDRKQIEYLNFLIQQERGNAMKRGLRY
jgi:hypothetical protein